jgi:hypothetical protein
MHDGMPLSADRGRAEVLTQQRSNSPRLAARSRHTCNCPGTGVVYPVLREKDKRQRRSGPDLEGVDLEVGPAGLGQLERV